MSRTVHDRAEQLALIQQGLLEGETVDAVYDCIGVGTAFVGITDKRVVVQDMSFVGGKMAITSVPYKNIRSVSMVS
ncbi:PH domain-containing protein, partial [Arthrobacter deserti]|nr:PH domain-containing protein [Arthrobacter deserti]